MVCMCWNRRPPRDFQCHFDTTYQLFRSMTVMHQYKISVRRNLPTDHTNDIDRPSIYNSTAYTYFTTATLVPNWWKDRSAFRSIAWQFGVICEPDVLNSNQRLITKSVVDPATSLLSCMHRSWIKIWSVTLTHENIRESRLNDYWFQRLQQRRSNRCPTLGSSK